MDEEVGEEIDYNETLSNLTNPAKREPNPANRASLVWKVPKESRKREAGEDLPQAV